jgi:hypothetical protein
MQSMTRRIRVCPRCGSTQIKEAKHTVSGWLVPTTYYCEEDECTYSGPIYAEVEAEELEQVRQILNGSSKETEAAQNGT